MTSPRTARPSGGVRLDIQLLRAIAVGLVVVYHLWPNRLPGGFVGVDVFFVISGFLITSHLVKSAGSEHGISLGRFWASRARRLLPLSSVVLLSMIVGVFAFAPESAWKATLQNIVASALYVENWSLAAGSVDYLARDQAPLVTQHFWSLSVEEQFYIVWPVLIIVASYLAVKGGTRRLGTDRAKLVRRGVLVAIWVILVASLGYSVWLTNLAPGTAYFATTTRAWEFAAGGLLVFVATPRSVASRNQASRMAASWFGFALIVASAFLLSDSTPFPGIAAALPVAGAALFMWAGNVHSPYAPTVFARFRPITFLGDISYGIYLWHWPLIVLVPYAVNHPLGPVSKIGIIVVTVALAAVSKVVVEDPFRYRKFWTIHVRRSFYPAAAGIGVVCLVCSAALSTIDSAAVRANEIAAAAPPVTLGTTTDPDAPLTPPLANRLYDRGPMFDCLDLDHTKSYVCSYGPDAATVSLAVTGDSHAAQFIPALIDIVEKNGWRLTTYVGVSCDAGLSRACGGGRKTFNKIVDGDYDLVLYSAYRGSTSSYQDVAEFMSALIDADVNLLPIADVPMNPPSAYACIDASKGDAGKAEKCTIPRQTALNDVPDRIAPISTKLGVPYVDLTDAFCDADTCHTISGNTIIYQDSPTSHFTATFAHLLTPRLETAINSALAAPLELAPRSNTSATPNRTATPRL